MAEAEINVTVVGNRGFILSALSEFFRLNSTFLSFSARI